MLGMTAAWKLVKCIFTVWRFKQMVKHTMNVAKGIGMGVLAGVAVAAVSSKVMNGGHKKASHMRKSAGKAMHSATWKKCSADRLRRGKTRRRPPAAGSQEGPKPCGPRPRLEEASPQRRRSHFLKYAGQAPRGRPGDFFSTYSIPRTRAKENRQVSACLLVI